MKMFKRIKQYCRGLFMQWDWERPRMGPVAADAAPPTPVRRAPLNVSSMLIARASMPPEQRAQAEGQGIIERYEPPPGVIPPLQHNLKIAQDSTPYDYVNEAFYCAERFRGYPYLAMLSQIPEYRKMSETIAKQMVRKWIRVTSKGEDGSGDKVTKMEDALKKFKVREVFEKAAELDGFFGRGQIYVDVQTPRGRLPARDDADELQTPLLRTPAKIRKDSLIGFNLVEPMWTYPNTYNSTDPLAPSYYKPSSWFVMGKIVHTSRLLMFSSRPVPDILKASYNFGGLALSQLAEPAVNNWLRTRDSVSDLIHSYSLSGIATDLSAELSGGGVEGGMMNRAELYNNMRDNRGLLLINKDTEEFFQFNTPLSGLDKLQAQAQEQPAAVANIPLVFLLGITPQGLNASSEGEIETFYSYIASMQQSLFADNLKSVFEIIQLSEFGAISPDIGFEFEPLDEMDPEQRATIEKTKADTDAVLITSGIIDPDEARERIGGDESNDYHGLKGAAPGIEEDDEEDDNADANA